MTVTRKLNAEDETRLPEHIRIAKDGEVVRILGAWVGNKTNDHTPWKTILEKINTNLEKWEKVRPTIRGRRLIVQTIVGGHTQFLAKAQGMPTKIEDALNKIITNYIWQDDSSPRIALNTLQRPLEEGGLNLLNIRSRNEAIEITWLKSYLNFTANRPTWATIMDLTINATTPAGAFKRTRTNPFLQTWNAPTKGRLANYLNDDIRRMMKTAKKYGTNLAAIRLTPQLRAQLPAFYHLMSETVPLNNAPSKCLATKHGISTVADLISTSARLRNQQRNIPHRNSNFCNCHDCNNDRTKDCYHPHRCAIEAQNRISKIHPKLNPMLPGERHDGLSLTHTRKTLNAEAKQTNEKILFDPSITSKNNLAECFRIFVEPDQITNRAAQRQYPPGGNPRIQERTVYTDGACLNNGKRNARCGGGIWISHNNQENRALRVPGDAQSNQVGEIAAIIAAVEATPKSQPLTIISDSKYAIEGLTSHLETWEDRGWIGIKNADFFKKAAFLLRSRTATTHFKWVKGHEGTEGNEESDKLAKEGANKLETDQLDLHIPNEYNIQGAKIIKITQTLAYEGIKAQAPIPICRSTIKNLKKTRDAIRTFQGTDETNKTIWLGLHKAVLRPKIRQFLYKCMHATQKIGDFWSHIPNYEDRQPCVICETPETMEHILVECRGRTPQIIWDLAKNLWPHQYPNWPEMNLGMILGCGSLKINNQINNARQGRDKTHKGATRLLQIIISESSHLIWVIRCERVIQENSYTNEEIKAKWYNVINARLTDDKIAATRIKRNETFTNLIRDTWEDVLKKEWELPPDWLKKREVLVGSGTQPLRNETS